MSLKDPVEKEMATHSSVLAWRIPWTEEPGRLQSVGWQESDTTEQLSTQHTHSFLAGLEWLLFLNDMNFYLILIY